ncbi:major facilitator superfamily domain-containing protein [Ilyonectria sp. MPI-CAGE-AT-0026]|nr:major facilitator superfamily domain-containing protein [Ilyonectria sp. MPI-CAGE-AT-0026]
MTASAAHTVSWEEGDQKPANPMAMSKTRRWLIVVIVSSGSLCVACTSSLYASAQENLQIEFGCSRQVATLGLSLFVFGLGLGPMILAPLSEFYGRRPIYVYSFSLFVVWLLPCALAQNMSTMLVGRFFDGFAGSAFLSVAGGTVSDLFSGHELSAPMMVYTAAPFLGPEIGPLVGGFINQYCPWRWSFYFLLIWGGIELVLILVFVPETYHPILLCQKARRIRLETGDDRWKAPMEPDPKRIAHAVLDSCKRPFQLLIFEPMCLNLCILSAILLGILYLFFGAFPLIFSTSHNFTLSQSGLSFLGLLVGMIFGIISDPIWRNNYQRLVRRRNDDSDEVDSRADPEFRLVPSIVGSIVIPVAIFGFGWTSYSSIHWIVPIIFSSFFGFGIILVYSAIFTFLVECYPMYAASALAANSFVRSSFAAAFPLFGYQLYQGIGFQWATSVLAFLALAMSPFPYIFYVFGKRLRKNSRFSAK